MRMGGNPSLVSVGEVTSQLTLLSFVLTFASSQDSEMTVSLRLKVLEHLGCLQFSPGSWGWGSLQRQPRPRKAISRGS